MKRAKKISKPTHPARDHELRMLAWLTVCVSVVSFLYYFQRGDVLLYGDAIGHINIARRVFDSRTPGLLQLGTVWLPLPHLLMIPFLLSRDMWQTGIGGSIPSLAAYVVGVIGIFRLVRGVLRRDGESSIPAKVASWVAALIYATNPNLIYMQTTGMGEVLYLALFIWAVVYFSEFTRGDAKALTKCGLCLAAACLTRYDGWFLTVAMVVAVVVHQYFCAILEQIETAAPRPQFSRVAIAKFLLITAAAPALWLGYNAAVYRNPLEFENGPYSAKAIEKRTQSASSVGHPGTGNLYVAELYFLKAAESNVAANEWLQRLWLVFAALAVVGVAVDSRKLRREENVADKNAQLAAPPHYWPLIFLLVPLPFYALSVAYGGVPIFVPAWWPFSHYNVRYGLELLPAISVALALVVYLALKSKLQGAFNWLSTAAIIAVFFLVVDGYGTVWRAGPVCYKEAFINMRSRNALEKQLADWLKLLPPDSTLLMYLGDHVGAVQQAGIPLKRTINEGNHRTWKQPVDPEGLWERALANPTAYADYAVAFEGDPVWQSVHEKHPRELVEIQVSGQSRAVLYRLR